MFEIPSTIVLSESESGSSLLNLTNWPPVVSEGNKTPEWLQHNEQQQPSSRPANTKTRCCYLLWTNRSEGATETKGTPMENKGWDCRPIKQRTPISEINKENLLSAWIWDAAGSVCVPVCELNSSDHRGFSVIFSVQQRYWNLEPFLCSTAVQSSPVQSSLVQSSIVLTVLWSF